MRKDAFRAAFAEQKATVMVLGQSLASIGRAASRAKRFDGSLDEVLGDVGQLVECDAHIHNLSVRQFTCRLGSLRS